MITVIAEGVAAAIAAVSRPAQATIKLTTCTATATASAAAAGYSWFFCYADSNDDSNSVKQGAAHATGAAGIQTR